MEAHAAAGNRAEALRVYERCRRLLARSSEPTPRPRPSRSTAGCSGRLLPGLQRRHPRPRRSQISSAHREPGSRGPRRRRPLVAGAAAIVILGAIAAVVVLTRGGSNDAAVGVAANSRGFIDGKTGRVREEVKIEKSPTSVAVGNNSVWVTNSNDATVSQIDPDTSSVHQTVSVGNSPGGIAVGRGSVWVANHADGTVSWINAGSSTVVQDDRRRQRADRRRLRRGLCLGDERRRPLGLQDRSRHRCRGSRRSGPTHWPRHRRGRRSVWVTDESTRAVFRIDPTTNDVSDRINVGNGPAGIAYGAGAIWVANSLDRTVSKIDPATASVTATVTVGVAPGAIVVGADAVWVSAEFGERVLRLDPRSDPGRVVSFARCRKPPERARPGRGGCLGCRPSVRARAPRRTSDRIDRG